MVLLFWALTGAAWAEDTGDTADTADTAGEGRDTDPYVDTAAVAEEVYVEDVGCSALPGAAGSGAALAALGMCLAAAVGARRG